MTKFESFLINRGIYYNCAIQYNRTVEKFLNWLKLKGLTPGRLKRSQFTDYLEQLRLEGNKEGTIRSKEGAIRQYYYFIKAKHNPAINWIRPKRETTLPPKALEKDELQRIYEELKPNSPADYRNRCMLGLVLFQGLLRSELQELRVGDVDLEKGVVFVQGQRKTNSRKLKLEPIQLLHLYDYLHKYRRDFVACKKEVTDNFFLSKGTGKYLNNAVCNIINEFKIKYPQIVNLRHIRGSVITNWEKEQGIIEAMTKAGHRYISSTQRYQTGKYEELQDLLKTKHPMESLDLSGQQ
jgi:integrase/recombinase XerD